MMIKNIMMALICRVIRLLLTYQKTAFGFDVQRLDLTYKETRKQR